MSTRGYSRVTKLPQQLRSLQFDKSWNHLELRSEPVIEPPKTANALKLWKWEVFNCVLAIGMLGSMYGILLHYDEKPIPDWGTAINLSTLVALMATSLRTMLAFVVSEIIGQAKWNNLTGGRGVSPEDTAPVRRLIETSRFNDASQGLLGAFRLLPTITRDPATLTAVMIMIVSLGIGSFVQQAIQTQSCQFAARNVHVALPISRNITAYNTFTFQRGPTNTFAALTSSLSPESEEIGSPIYVRCSTGNCTFDNPIGGLHSTLGVCSSCVDTSPLIKSTGWKSIPSVMESHETNSTFEVAPGLLTANYSLPNGMLANASCNSSVNFMGTTLSASAWPDQGLEWAGNIVSSEMKALSQWAIANVTIFTSGCMWPPTSSELPDYVAATCTLYPCLRSFTASVTSGELDEVIVRTIPAAPNVAAPFSKGRTIEDIERALQEFKWSSAHMPEVYNHISFQAIRSPCLINDTMWTRENKSSTLDLQRLLWLHVDPDPSGGRRFTTEDTTAPAECIYGMDMTTWSNLISEMTSTSIFNGTCNAYAVLNDTTNLPVACDQESWLARFFNDEGTTAASIIKRMEGFADRLSNKMRMGLLDDAETVSGQVLQMSVCSRIQYSWLAFPVVLVAVTSGLLAWTIFQSSRGRGRVKVWKTSILPFLFYGEQFVVQNGENMSADSIESLRREGAKEPLLDLDQMEAEAKQRRVRFDMFN